MSVNVVKELRYGSTTGYCKDVRERVEVPDMYDLSCKASNSDLKNLQTTVENKIEDLKEDLRTEIARNVNTVSISFDLKVEELKSIIKSDERLREEEKVLRSIGDQITNKILNGYLSLQDSIHKEVEAFQQMDLLLDLQSVVSPVQNAIEKIEKKLEKINPAEIERLICILDEIKRENAEVDTKKKDVSRMVSKTINEFVNAVDQDNSNIRNWLVVLTIIVGVLGVTVIGIIS